MSGRYGTFVPGAPDTTDDYCPRSSSEITLVDAGASAIILENVSLLKGKRGGEGVTRKPRTVELALSYGIFFVLGSCTLLAWNSEIVAGSYFRARLEGSELQSSFSNWVALTFTVANLAFLFLANLTQHGSDLAKRISYSILLMIVMLGLLVASTQVDQLAPELFFVLLIGATIILAYSASYLQNGVVGLSSRYGHSYLQGAMSGQGAVEVAVALVQFVSAYTSEDPVEVPGFTADPTVPRGIKRSALLFFSAVTLFSIIAYALQAVLVRLPLYRLVLAGSSSNSDSSDSLATLNEEDEEPIRPSLLQVERKVRSLGLAVLYVFAVTISVFPSITSSILSVHDPEQGKTGGLGPTLSTPELFVSIGFVVFAVGDWMGRMIPGVKAFKLESKRGLICLSLARTVFIPLFLMCNVASASAGPGTQPIFNSDFIFLGIMVLFGLSNGYTSTLIMLAGVAESSLEPHEIESAATCLSMYLTAGLAVGSLLSFPVRAALCNCNPFL